MRKSCREIATWLGDFAADDWDVLPGDQAQAARRRQLQAHLAECSGCREKLNELRWVDRLLTVSLQQAAWPPRLTLPAGALAPPGRRIGWFRPALAAAIALAGIVFWSSRGRQPRSEQVAQNEPASHNAGAARPRPTELAGINLARDEHRWTDLQTAIEREANAAMLAAAAEAMAEQPAADHYALQALQFIAATYPETHAGIEAGRRVASWTVGPKEHQQ